MMNAQHTREEHDAAVTSARAKPVPVLVIPSTAHEGEVLTLKLRHTLALDLDAKARTGNYMLLDDGTLRLNPKV